MSGYMYRGGGGGGSVAEGKVETGYADCRYDVLLNAERLFMIVEELNTMRRENKAMHAYNNLRVRNRPITSKWLCRP